MAEKLTNETEWITMYYHLLGGNRKYNETEWVYPYPDLPRFYRNWVYDTNLGQWVHWNTVGVPDDSGDYYPYELVDWKAGTYSWDLLFGVV